MEMCVAWEISSNSTCQSESQEVHDSVCYYTVSVYIMEFRGVQIMHKFEVQSNIHICK